MTDFHVDMLLCSFIAVTSGVVVGDEMEGALTPFWWLERISPPAEPADR